MTQEEKQLLLKALCGYLPYGFKYQVQYGDTCIRTPEKVILDEEYTLFDGWQVHEIKPYLRPLSSMTEEEKKQYQILTPIVEVVFEYDASRLIDWLNKNMFDYRGMIEKGFALPAPEGMYEIN
jgi:hypothetical protein